MLKGIDISNWQKGIVPSKLGVKFCICKATEGLSFTDAYCNGFVQDCIENNLMWGFYHFANTNDPVKEADYFYNECRGYFGKGVPVLDYEVSNKNNVEWCEKFLKRLHELTGIWAMLYISASRCGEYENSWIPEKCGLWIAGYPAARESWISENTTMPYSVYPWKFAAIWQFTSSLKLKNWSGCLDGDVAYMDAKAWKAYAGKYKNADTPKQDSSSAVQSSVPSKTCEQLADEVMAGKWGNGYNRQTALDGAYGEGTYQHVQTIVDMRLGLDGC